MPSFGKLDVRRTGFVAAALVITLYGGLLRFEALEANYGWLGQPAWSERLARLVGPAIKHLRPSSIVWGPTRDPYVGSDPINYLKYAREMTHFYQGHTREPVFLALTRAYLWLTGGRDISLSFASATGATLAILATYLLGAAAFSKGVGLGAALALAIEVTAIARSFEGWRDDTFMFVVALTGWSFLRLRQQPGRTTGIIAGLAAAAACLTRITSLSFVIPGLLWLLVETRGRAVQKDVRLAALVLVVLVAPYLVNCARVFGDPFVSISEHTTYYRAAEGLPHEQPMGVWSYLSTKIGSRPIRSIDTAAEGIVLHPFRNKWNGFDRWGTLLGPLLRLSAAAGMALAVWSPNGRFLLMLLFASLLPYALTWSVGGGGDWRHAARLSFLPDICVLDDCRSRPVDEGARGRRIRTTMADQSALHSANRRGGRDRGDPARRICGWAVPGQLGSASGRRCGDHSCRGTPLVVFQRRMVTAVRSRTSDTQSGTGSARGPASSHGETQGLLDDFADRSRRNRRSGAAAGRHRLSQSAPGGSPAADTQRRRVGTYRIRVSRSLPGR
jgi:hypothetical protein